MQATISNPVADSTIPRATPVPSPGDAVRANALEHTLRLARSAHLELGFALAMQCAWMEGSRTPGHIHAMLTLPRAELAERFRQAASQQDSNAAQHHPAWKTLIRKAMARDAEYNSRVVSLQTPHCVSSWTFATGQLADDILGFCVDSDAYWQLFADTAKDIQDCYFLHIA